ncbi:hypothetical protein AM469_006260, partial [Pseudomonas aeruginosa]
MAAETLYREGRLSVSAIGEKLHISKSTLYSYLRHVVSRSARTRRAPGHATSSLRPRRRQS